MDRKPERIETRLYRTGQVIFREGDDPRDEAFLVHAGRIEVHKRVGQENRVLHVLVKGERLNKLVRTNPALAVAIIRDLSVKLRATNELLVAEGRRHQAERA
jgi:CRP-like cAMP-binding protein